MTRISLPRVTIGLPVYNGANYLARSLDSLLGQSFADWELVIADNASTDDTEGICRDYLRRDPRIRYVRHARNIGATPNHNFTVREARGELFKWAAHDDLYGADLLARCVEVLDERPEIVLCNVDMAMIDDRGEIIRKYDYLMPTDSPHAPERFRCLLETEGGDDEYGVIRTEVLRRIHPYASYHNPGRTFITELALHGPFHLVPELLYFRRDHPGRCDRLPSVSAICANLDPERAGQSTARLVGEYLYGYVAAIRDAPLTGTDRRRCYRHLLSWMTGRALGTPTQRIGTVPTFVKPEKVNGRTDGGERLSQ